MEKQENASARLVSDAAGFFGIRSSGQEDPCAGGAGRSDQHPTLGAALAVGRWGVFDQVKGQHLGKECNRLVIVANNKRDVAEKLGHCSSLEPAYGTHVNSDDSQEILVEE